MLSRLRRAVAPARVEGRDGVALAVPEPAWVDVEAADAALRGARASEDPARRLACAQEATRIVELGLLPGLEAPWLTDERTALEHARIEALELGADAARTIEPALAETLARAAVAGAPFRESAWAALIAALQARGNVAEALHAYDEVRPLLRDELGAVPGRDLVALHGRLLADDAGSDPRVAPRPRRPEAAAHLVEREDELRAVDSTLDRLAEERGEWSRSRGRPASARPACSASCAAGRSPEMPWCSRPERDCSSASSPSGSSASCWNRWPIRA